MAQGSRTARRVLVSLGTLGILLSLVASSGVPAAPGSGHAPTVVGASLSPPPPMGSRSVLLVATSSTVAAGTGTRFLLNVTPLNCLSGALPNQSVSAVVFQLGDGFVFQEPGPPAETSWMPACTEAPWNVSIPLVYAYRTTGTEHIRAFVTWNDGFTLSSNTVTVNVTSPSLTTLSVLQTWFWGAVAASAATFAACFALRRYLPKSPSLPPRMV